jgi:hypothetical protein
MSFAFDRNAHRLPDGWRHLSRSIRAAVGTVFGGITFVDLRPDAVELALEEPDFMWQDFADDYLGYAVYWLLMWGDSTTKRRQELWDFDTWLVRTERREPLGQSQSDVAATRLNAARGREEMPRSTAPGWRLRGESPSRALTEASQLS